MKPLLLLIASIAMLLACSKKGGYDAAKEQALTTGTWKMTDYKNDQGATFANIADCDKDNIITFKPGGEYISDEGPTKCFGSTPQTVTSTWSFKDDQAVLVIGSSNYDIQELTQTTLKIGTKASYNVFYTMTIWTTYTKQ